MNKSTIMTGLLCALMLSACKETTVELETSALLGGGGDMIYYTKVSPDGSKGTIYRINSDGTGKEQISDNDNSRIVGSPYGSTMVYTTWKDDGVYKVMRASADGTNPHVVTSVADPFKGNGVINHVLLSPASNKILYTVDVSDGSAHFSGLHVINMDGSNDIFTDDDISWQSLPVFSPDGNSLAYMANPSHVAGGDLLYTINVSGADKQISANATSVSGSFDALDWSSDGTRIACVRDKNLLGNGKTNLQVVHTDGTALTSFDQFEASMPVFSPDGKQIACFSGNTLKIVNIDGTNVQTLNVSPTEPVAYPQWSPDGKSILFTVLNVGSPALYGTLKIVNIETEVVTTLDDSVYKGYWKK